MGQRAHHRSVMRRMAKLEQKNQSLELRLERMTGERNGYKSLYEALKRRLFGRRSEYVSPDQLFFEFERLMKEGLDAAAAELAEKTTQEQAKEGDDEQQQTSAAGSRHRGRRPLPPDLPRRRKLYELSPSERSCPCCASAMVEIGEDVTEELEYKPASFYVIEHVRIKYACRACDQAVARAPMPDRPIERGRPGPGLLAHLAVAKYGDHLPLYRLEGIFAREGVEICRQTMCQWIAQLADLVSPLVSELKRQLLCDPLLQSDDTGIPYQGDLKGRVSKGYLWVYTRPYAEVVFDFTTNHSRAGPIEFLGDFRGYLQTDGHSSYNGVYATGKVAHIGCLAHVRRKFFEAREEAPDEAAMALAAIQSLYRIERDAKTAGISGADLVELRQREAGPVLTAMSKWIAALSDKYRPKSQMAKAIGYARRQWPAIVRYTEIAEAHIDNNSSEQAIKPVVIGRNYVHQWIMRSLARCALNGAIVAGRDGLSVLTRCA